MMEVIHSDFARLEADTSADEATAAKEFETFMDESARLLCCAAPSQKRARVFKWCFGCSGHAAGQHLKHSQSKPVRHDLLL